jgi:hypothetical protein
MPLLNSTYLANWYKLTIPYYQIGALLPTYDKILVESFTQSKVQEASNKGMIQGDIGVRVMDIGTLYYSSTLSGPIIVTDADSPNEFSDLFNLISNNIAYQTYGTSGTNGTTYLLKSAQIQVSTETVRATANFEGDYEINPTSYNGDTPSNVDLLARTARFYDTKFYFGTLTNYYAVISGDININFDLDKNFFLGQNWIGTVPSQSPYFSIRGYSATGNVKIALTPDQYSLLVSGVNGIGKTLLVELILKKHDYNIINLSIDDDRDKETITQTIKPLLKTKKTFDGQENCLVVSDIDCNGGDYGFISILTECIKETHIPIICICDDRYSQNIKPILNYCIDMKLIKPSYEDIYTLIYKVVSREQIKIGKSSVEKLYEQSNGDIRFILNSLQLGNRKINGNKNIHT